MKKRVAIVLTCLLCFSLSACGQQAGYTGTAVDNATVNQGGEEEENSSQEQYMLQEISFPGAREALAEILPEGAEKYTLLYGPAGSSLYAFEEVYPEAGNYEKVQYYVQMLSAPYQQWESIPVELSESLEGKIPNIRRSYLTPDGTVKLLLDCGDGIYTGQWTMDQGLSVKKHPEMPDLAPFYDEHAYGGWLDDETQGTFYFNEEEVLRYGADGQPEDTELGQTGGLILQAVENPYNGQLYFAGASQDAWDRSEGSITIRNEGFSIWTADDKSPVYERNNNTAENVFLSGEDGDLVFASETEGYLGNPVGLFRLSLEDGTAEKIYDFADAGIGQGTASPIQTMELSVDENGDVYVFCTLINGQELFGRIALQSSGDKQELSLAIVGADSYLKKAVVDFNKQSDTYKVILQECPSGESPEDYRNRLLAQLNTGKGPDIMDQSVLNLSTGAAKGYLADLTEVCKSYQNMMFSGAKQLGKVGDSYYGIPYAFRVQTMVADRDVVGDRIGWTLEEAMKTMEESGAKSFAAKQDGGYLYYYMGLLTENKALIDWENGISLLQEQDGVHLLEFSMKYADDGSNGEQTAEEQLASGESLTEILYLTTPDTIRYLSQYMQGRETYIGFPTADGKGGSQLSGNILAVNATTPYREGAEELIRFLLSEEQQNAIPGAVSGGYPVREQSLEDFFAEGREQSQKAATEKGDTPELTQQQWDDLWNLLGNARVYNEPTEMVWNILLEESGAFQSGSRSAQEVMDVVNNRVQLYLDEMR